MIPHAKRLPLGFVQVGFPSSGLTIRASRMDYWTITARPTALAACVCQCDIPKYYRSVSLLLGQMMFTRHARHLRNVRPSPLTCANAPPALGMEGLNVTAQLYCLGIYWMPARIPKRKFWVKAAKPCNVLQS